MQCTSPATFPKSGKVPCGQCMACRLNRTREWGVRIMQEMESWKDSCFVTLTYDNEHLPEDNGLHKEHWQLFMKRLRRDYEPEKLKFLACGEYGDEFGRPHYHAVLFGVKAKDERIKDNWPYGFVRSDILTYERATYVAGYILKKITGKMQEEKYGGRQPPFQLQSQALGKAWAIENKSRLLENLGFTVKGRKVALPRYYRKIFGDEISNEKLEQRMIARANEREEFLNDHGVSRMESTEFEKGCRSTKKLEIEQKLAIKRKRNF